MEFEFHRTVNKVVDIDLDQHQEKPFKRVHDDTVLLERRGEQVLMTFLPVSTKEEDDSSKPQYHR